jgi:hypothetical protein
VTPALASALGSSGSVPAPIIWTKRTDGAIASVAASIGRRALTSTVASAASPANSSSLKSETARTVTSTGSRSANRSARVAKAGSASRTVTMDDRVYKS